jgi:hypothetical protein
VELERGKNSKNGRINIYGLVMEEQAIHLPDVFIKKLFCNVSALQKCGLMVKTNHLLQNLCRIIP